MAAYVQDSDETTIKTQTSLSDLTAPLRRGT
jgi:hypothetical protein